MLPRTTGTGASRGNRKHAALVCEHVWSNTHPISVPRLPRKLRATDDTVEMQSDAVVSHQIDHDDVDTAATVTSIPDPTPAPTRHATLQQPATPPTPPTLRERVMSNRLLAGSVAAGAAFLGGTFLIAVFRVLRKYNSPKERRKRTVDKNKV